MIIVIHTVVHILWITHSENTVKHVFATEFPHNPTPKMWITMLIVWKDYVNTNYVNNKILIYGA